MKMSKNYTPIFCRACNKADHLMADCPDKRLPACVPLPPPSAKHREILSDLLVEIKGKKGNFYLDLYCNFTPGPDLCCLIPNFFVLFLLFSCRSSLPAVLDF